MNLGNSALAVAAGALTLTVQMPLVAHADQIPTAPCVSDREFDRVHAGMSLHRVSEIFDGFRGKVILIGYESRTFDGDRIGFGS